MAEKLTHLWIPGSYKDIGLPADEALKRELLTQYNGKLALIKDSHFWGVKYSLVRLRIDSNDAECYYAQTISENGEVSETRMFFNDLEGLLVQGDGILFRHDFE